MHEDGWDKYQVYELGEFLYRTTVKILHEDCGHRCSTCSGSGEGMADGSTCQECKGKGWIKRGPGGEQQFEVSWSEDTMRDLDAEDGDPTVCEHCGYDFLEDIKEELKWLKKHGNNSSKKNTLM
jgi:hypothetical protein